MQAAAVGVHRDHRGEVLHLQLPDGFRRPKFILHVDVADPLHALGQNLRGTADGMDAAQ